MEVFELVQDNLKVTYRQGLTKHLILLPELPNVPKEICIIRGTQDEHDLCGPRDDITDWFNWITWKKGNPQVGSGRLQSTDGHYLTLEFTLKNGEVVKIGGLQFRYSTVKLTRYPDGNIRYRVILEVVTKRRVNPRARIRFRPSR